MYLIWAADHALQLPSCLTVAQVFPFYHIKPIYVNIHVQYFHISQVNVIVRVLKKSLAVTLLVKPIIVKAARIKLLDVFFGCYILNSPLCE